MPDPSEAEGRSKIVFWTALDSEREAACSELAAKYNMEAREGAVELVNFPSRSALREELERTQSPPDLALIDTLWQADLVDRKAIIPVEDLMNRVNDMLRVVYKMDTFPRVWLRSVHKGKAWTIPIFAESYALICNTDLLTKKGIQKAPQTWQEVVAAGQKLTDPEKHQWGFVIPLHLSVQELADIWTALLEEQGGLLLDPNTREVAFNSKEGKDALQLMADLIHKHKVSPPHETSGALVAAMMLGTPDDARGMESRHIPFSVASWPKARKRANNLRVDALAVMKTTPEREKPAWKFARWLTEFEALKHLAMSTHYPPVNRVVWMAPDYLQLLKEKKPWMQTYIDQLQTASVSLEAIEYYERVLTALGIRVLEVLQNKRDPGEALDSAAKEVKEILAGKSVGPRQ
ncbi:MAG: extracellular solute-binding protein [Armatimonadetes bacterium]|nr:extracellular solute-binding protein [Armatimonadota bacterium]